jgi:putative ABC transport system ATP-binding protein
MNLAVKVLIKLIFFKIKEDKIMKRKNKTLKINSNSYPNSYPNSNSQSNWEEQESSSDNTKLSQTPRSVNIKCQNLIKVYKQGNLEVLALKNINLTIYKGEIVVIMGPSGSGKTTLLNCIAGLESPTAGKIFVRNYEINKLNSAGIELLLQEEVGIVFQFFNLIQSLTVKANVELPMVIANKSNSFINKRRKDLLKQVGLDDRSLQRPSTLSGGEKQRVAIAMAFANEPTIVMADEPTGNIDSISGEKVLKIFVDFIKNNPDKSIVIVSHDHNLRKIADRTILLKDGKIIRELGKLTHTELEETENDELTQIYQEVNGDTEIEELLDPTARVKSYDQIVECNDCGSSNIQKMFDKKAGDFKVRNGQLITRAVINCSHCHHMNYSTVSIQDVKDEL